MHDQSGSRAQSAMEYLMTYGWAILIIAVVLGALYYLGVFNTSNLAPRAQPGSCKVVRPNGPGTTTFINLAGVCTGQLPLFVGSFDGASSYVGGISGAGLSFTNTDNFAVSVWAKYFGPVAGYTVECIAGKGIYSAGNGVYGIDYATSGSIRAGVRNGANAVTASYSPPDNFANWHYIVFTYTSNDVNGIKLYVDGTLKNSQSNVNMVAFSSGTFKISPSSVLGGNPTNFYGQISNVQVYNTSLDANEVQGLYVEGIGGAPTRLQNLVGWWPLNDDANDYSGNGNNGVPTSVVFASTWTK